MGSEMCIRDRLRVLQLLSSSDHEEPRPWGSTLADPSPAEQEGSPPSVDNLSTIPEDEESVGSYLQHPCPEMQKYLDHLPCDQHFKTVVHHNDIEEESKRMPLGYLRSIGDSAMSPLPSMTNEEYVELSISRPMTNTMDLSVRPQRGQMVLLQIGPSNVRQEVVQRDDDVLTTSQMKENWPAVQQAMLKELQTWANLKCFSRKRKADARNAVSYTHLTLPTKA